MDRKTILSEIKKLISFSTEKAFKDAKLVDGQTVIHVDGENFEVGAQLHVVTPDGMIPAPAGEHTTEDGTKIVVDEAGIITSVEQVEVAPAGEITPAEQQLADEVLVEEDFYTWDQCMLDMINEYDDEQIASAVCGKIKADGYIMSKEEAFAEGALLFSPDAMAPEGSTASMPESTDMTEELKKLKDKVAKMEAMVNDMLPVVKQSAEFSTNVLDKLDTFVKDTPAEMQFSSIKTEYKQFVRDNKERQFSGLEGIKNIRKK